jgi:hypothetical protein
MLINFSNILHVPSSAIILGYLLIIIVYTIYLVLLSSTYTGTRVNAVRTSYLGIPRIPPQYRAWSDIDKLPSCWQWPDQGLGGMARSCQFSPCRHPRAIYMYAFYQWHQAHYQPWWDVSLEVTYGRAFLGQLLGLLIRPRIEESYIVHL